MHIKHIHCMIESLANGLKENVNECMKPSEVGVVGATVDMLKDLCEAEYYARMAKYLEKEEEWEEEESKMFFPRMRDSKGRFVSGSRRGSRMGFEMPIVMDEPPYWHMMPEHLDRDMDMEEGRIYTGAKPSRYGYSHDEYMKEKKAHPGQDETSKRIRMEKLDEHLNDLEDMTKEMVAGMSQEEKQAWKVKLNKLINM